MRSAVVVDRWISGAARIATGTPAAVSARTASSRLPGVDARGSIGASPWSSDVTDTLTLARPAWKP